MMDLFGAFPLGMMTKQISINCLTAAAAAATLHYGEQKGLTISSHAHVETQLMIPKYYY